MYALARIDNSFPYQKKTAPYGAAFLVYAQMARAALRASPVASMELPGAWRASPITMTCGARSLSFYSRVLLDL